MKIVVGLGNPGQQYQATRHNVGFDLLDELRRVYFGDATKKKFDAEISEITVAGQRVLLVAPQTFMNNSGFSVQKAVAFYQTPPQDLLVACDDFSIPLGRIRLRPSGSSGGQKGLESTIRQLGTQDFPRLRLGIGPVPAGRQAADFVLGRFAKDEQTTVRTMLEQAVLAVEEWLKNGAASAMNRFNSEFPSPAGRTNQETPRNPEKKKNGGPPQDRTSS